VDRFKNPRLKAALADERMYCAVECDGFVKAKMSWHDEPRSHCLTSPQDRIARKDGGVRGPRITHFAILQFAPTSFRQRLYSPALMYRQPALAR
jgi:hypothetical protein